MALVDSVCGEATELVIGCDAVLATGSVWFAVATADQRVAKLGVSVRILHGLQSRSALAKQADSAAIAALALAVTASGRLKASSSVVEVSLLLRLLLCPSIARAKSCDPILPDHLPFFLAIGPHRPHRAGITPLPARTLQPATGNHGTTTIAILIYSDVLGHRPGQTQVIHSLHCVRIRYLHFLQFSFQFCNFDSLKELLSSGPANRHFVV